jgi:hypothetical protein
LSELRLHDDEAEAGATTPQPTREEVSLLAASSHLLPIEQELLAALAARPIWGHACWQLWQRLHQKVESVNVRDRSNDSK